MPRIGRKTPDRSRTEYRKPSDGLERAAADYRRSRRKRRKTGFFFSLSVFLFVLLAAGAALFAGWKIRFGPSGEQMSAEEWFGVPGNQAAVFLNDASVPAFISYKRDGTVCLPLSAVTEYLTPRFFENDDGTVSYSRADRTEDLSFGEPSEGLFRIGTEAYIPLPFLCERMDLTVREFDSDGVRRVFLYTGTREQIRAELTKSVRLRSRATERSPWLTELPEGLGLTMLREENDFAEVVTDNGWKGYVPVSALGEHRYEVLEAESRIRKPDYLRSEEKVVLAWHYVDHKSMNQGLERLVSNTGGVLNVVCPTWLQIQNAAGELTDYSDADYVKKAHELGLKVWATVDNFNQPGGLKDFSTADFFKSRKNRRGFIESLISKAKEFGYDGFNLDFEGIPERAGASYAQFFRELSIACRKEGLVLSIDNYVPYEYNRHYQLSEQGFFADYIVIMGYDEHTGRSSEPGSVASIGYTQHAVREALKNAPPEGIIHAVPFYTRFWILRPDGFYVELLGMKDAAESVKKRGIKLSWDEKTGQYYGEAETEKGLMKVWMEDERSLTEKLKLVREADLGGTGAWKLGDEPPEIWKIMDLNNE